MIFYHFLILNDKNSKNKEKVIKMYDLKILLVSMNIKKN